MSSSVKGYTNFPKRAPCLWDSPYVFLDWMLEGGYWTISAQGHREITCTDVDPPFEFVVFACGDRVCAYRLGCPFRTLFPPHVSALELRQHELDNSVEEAE